MKTQAFLVFEIMADAGNVVFTTPRIPVNEADVARLTATLSAPHATLTGQAGVQAPPAAFPAARPASAPVPAKENGSEPALLPLSVTPPKTLPIAEDYRISPDDAEAYREIGIPMSTGSPSEWSPSPRPLLEEGIRPGGDPRRHGSASGNAPLADGRGNTLVATPAASLRADATATPLSTDAPSAALHEAMG